MEYILTDYFRIRSDALCRTAFARGRRVYKA